MKNEKDYCIACKSPMSMVETDGNLGKVFVCVNEKCPRVGLLSVIGYKLVKEEKDGTPSKSTKK